MNAQRIDLRQSPVGGTVPPSRAANGMGKKKKSSHDLLCGCLNGPCTTEVCPSTAPWLTSSGGK